MQSLFSDIRECELLETLDDNVWDILLLTETWRKSKEEVWKTAKGHLFMGSGWEGERKGVAILLHRRHAKTFKSFMAESERICAADLNLNGERLRIIAAYLPDGSYDNATVEATYNKLDKLCDDATQAQRQVILGGDLSAMIGRAMPGEEECIGPYGVGRRSARGAWLTSWADL